MAAALIAGCDAASVGRGGPGGELRMALSLPDGTVGTVEWTISSSTNAPIASGTLGVSGSQRPMFAASLPPGAGDTVSLSVTTSTGEICTGTSAPFDVVAGQAVEVSVNLYCQGPPSDAGAETVGAAPGPPSRHRLACRRGDPDVFQRRSFQSASAFFRSPASVKPPPSFWPSS
jgi:hypothetical protein